jgi:ribosomal protein L11 methyltransferase
MENRSAPAPTYFLLTIENLRPDEADPVSAECFEWGATGVQEDLPFRQDGEFYHVTELPRDVITLQVYFPESPSRQLIEVLQERYPNAKCFQREELNKDWLAEWKKGYVPFELVNEIYVVPSWLKAPVQAKQSIRIDPGMAFGTGTHETTRLAAELLPLTRNPQAVLDVGTGTGLLGFLAEVLGARKIVGLEIDPEARRTARENAELNHSKLEVPEHQIDAVKESFDLVIANIIDGVLVQLQSELKSKTVPGGHLILTGILEERDLGFRERFSFSGFQMIARRQKAEWIGYLLRKDR